MLPVELWLNLGHGKHVGFNWLNSLRRLPKLIAVRATSNNIVQKPTDGKHLSYHRIAFRLHIRDTRTIFFFNKDCPKSVMISFAINPLPLKVV